MQNLASQLERGCSVLVGMMQEGVIVHAEDGSVTSCSAPAERILGTSATRLVGSRELFTALQAVREDGLPLLPEEEPGRVTLRTGQPCDGLTLRIRRPDGEAAWVSVAASPLPPGAPGESAGALTVLLDITEQRSMEHKLRGTHRMEAIGRLAGGVAHDFNNLLTVILGYNDFLLRRLRPSDPCRHEAEEVRKAAQRAAELTRQLLAFGRQQVLEPRVLDLNAVLSDLHTMLGRLIGEDIHLRMALAPGLGMVRADPTQVEQVILNLVVNARDAMPLGGELDLSTADVDLDQEFVDGHPGSRAGPHVMLSVADNGCGMDPETQAHIFEPFFTTKARDKGTGLGLATVYGIVKQSQGYIGVESAPGRGTTFRVCFPRSRQVPEASSPEEPRKPLASARETILLVEDDEQVRRLARRILEELGYTVLEEADGRRALAALDRHPGPIDALVTDVVLPGLGGSDLARRATERRPGLRVLYLSGHADAAGGRRGELAPGARFLRKPFRAEALAEKLREVLAQPGQAA